METQAYYADHRALTAHRRARPATLDANRNRAHPIVPAKTQAAWLAQLKRLDDPHTCDLALGYLEQSVIPSLESKQVPSFLAVFSQSTDAVARRQCSRLGSLRVFAALCRTVASADLQPHAGRVAAAIALYCGDRMKLSSGLWRGCSIAARTSMTLAGPATAPFLSLLKATQSWQAQDGACECLRAAVEETTHAVEQTYERVAGSRSLQEGLAMDSVDLKQASKKMLSATRSALKRVHAKAKPNLYAVIVACLRATAVASGSRQALKNNDSNNVQLSGLLRSIADDLGAVVSVVAATGTEHGGAGRLLLWRWEKL